jgi:molybdopterin/thiamine biosynthesis adenylyltransferase
LKRFEVGSKENRKEILVVLTSSELERYDRQLLIRGVGLAGQERLKRARVVIAGAGGLGSTVAIYLAAAGIGTIGLIDHDEVRLTNLNRQILHWTGDVGRKKVASAAEKLKNMNPWTEIVAVDRMITDKNIADLLSGFDGVVDALDNLPTRFLLNKAAVDHGMPLFHGAVRAFEGRVMTVIPGKTACLRCVYRGAMPEEKIPVIGVAPAVVGSLQATEVIKYIAGIGKLLTDKFVVYDGLNMSFTELSVKRNLNCPHCASINRQGE